MGRGTGKGRRRRSGSGSGALWLRCVIAHRQLPLASTLLFSALRVRVHLITPPSPHPRPLPRTRRLTHHRQHLQTSSILGTKVRITHIYHSHPSSHPRPLPLLLPHDCLVPPNVEETRCAARKKQEEEKSVPLQDFVLKRLLVADCLQQCFLHNIKFDLYSLETCFPVLLGNFLKETLMQI